MTYRNILVAVDTTDEAEEVVKAVRELTDVKDSTISVVTVIRPMAENINADLIALGTHGRRGLGLMLGSTANDVLHGAPCDVLTVKVRYR